MKVHNKKMFLEEWTRVYDKEDELLNSELN